MTDQASEQSTATGRSGTVDDAEMKSVVVHLHRLLEPENPPVA